MPNGWGQIGKKKMKKEKSMRSKTVRISFFTVIAIALLTASSTYADNIYVGSAVGSIMKYDSSGNGSVYASGLNWPDSLSFDNRGNLYVANPGSMTITKFDTSKNRSTFASWTYGQPVSVACDRNGNLYAAVKSSSGGQDYIMKYDSSGSGYFFASSLTGANNLVFDSAGSLYAATYDFDADKPGKILKFDNNGNSSIYVSNIDYPQGLAFDKNNNLYIASYQGGSPNGTITKLDPSGNSSIFASGLWGTSGLWYPAPLSFDSAGNLYVGNAGNSTIMRFDTTGAHSLFASGGPNLNGPTSIVCEIPEPATLMLLGLGAAVVARRRR
jgi:sugar lactone lactonase YvrE